MGESTLTGTEFGRLNTNEGTYNIAWVGSYTYTQNQKANTTTLTLYGSMYTDSSSNVRSNNSSDIFKVNDVTISPPTPSAYRYSSSQTYGYSVNRYYSLFGSTTLTVTHNSNGTFPNTSVSLYAKSYHHNSLSNDFTISGLPTIDRTAPTVTISLSSRTTSSLTVAATASTTCDRWEYSTNNGSSYTQFSTTSGTSATATISGLAANTTYKVKIRARRSVNEVYGASSAGSYTTLDASAPVVTISLSSRTSSSLSIDVSADATCNKWEYSINNGSNYTQFSTTSGTSVSYTITGLSPNTTYNVKVRATKAANSVTGVSSTGAYTTLGAALLNSATEIYADAATVQVKINGTFYSSSYTHKLEIRRGSTVILTLTLSSQSAGTRDVTVTLTSAQRTTLLNGMSDVASFSATYALLTYNNSTQIGSASTATASIKTSSSTSAPAQPTFNYADTNSATVAVTGDSSKLIAGQSTLRLTSLSATAKNGASIASYTITIGGTTKTSTSGGTVDVGTISQSGTLALKVVAKDTRGYTNSKSVNVTVYAYTAPSLTSYSVKRNANTSTQIDFSTSGTFSNIGTNPVTLKYKYKKTSASSFGTEVTVTPTKSGGTFSYSANNIATFDEDSTYNFVITVQDGIQSAVYNLVVPTFAPLIAYRPNAIGFGAVPQGTKRVEIAQDWSLVANGKNNTFAYMPYSFGTYAGAGSAGYARIATITITGTWINGPVVFKVFRRNDYAPIELYLFFAGSSSTDPTLDEFHYSKPAGGRGTQSSSFAFAYKTSAGVWDVYIQKTEANDEVDVVTDVMRSVQNGVSVTYTDSFLSSVPSGAVMAIALHTSVVTSINVNTGYYSYYNTNITTTSKITVTQNYVSAGLLGYFFIVQPVNGYVNIYVRNPDRTLPPDSTSLQVTIAIDNG